MKRAPQTALVAADLLSSLLSSQTECLCSVQRIYYPYRLCLQNTLSVKAKYPVRKMQSVYPALIKLFYPAVKSETTDVSSSLIT